MLLFSIYWKITIPALEKSQILKQRNGDEFL